MLVLGLSGFYHDAAAALLRDGRVVAAAQEERFTRRRHDGGFPALAARWCLERAGVPVSALAAVAFYDKPILKLERVLHSFLHAAPRGLEAFAAAVPAWARRKLWAREIVREELGWRGEILFPEHHESHAASAFFPSPFRDAAVLTMDGVGEWATSSVARGSGARLELLQTGRFPHSLGLLYSAFTAHAGFKVNSGEYKLMGLAPLGRPRWAGLILSELMDLKEDGSLRLNLDYFDFASARSMTNERFDRLFGGPPRRPGEPLTERERDLAASAQAACEEVMLRAARHAVSVAGSRDLCLAGGVALNCVANARLLRERAADRLWIQPAAGDAGGALGAALHAWHSVLGRPRALAGGRDGQGASLLGPAWSAAEIEAELSAAGARWERLPPEAVASRTAGLLAEGRIAGWFQGRMEFGPRALGARSILADPRDPAMRERLNAAVKLREAFRPFAPAVPLERAAEWFELEGESPYMLLTAPVRPEKRGLIPAVTHADGSARVQTVRREDHPEFHALLEAFGRATGCPVLVNTSFNQRGEPMVRSPLEAYACFRRSGLDALILGEFLLLKEKQADDGDRWIESFEDD